MRATMDGNNWIINGSKMWITNSYEAEVFANVRASCIFVWKAHSKFFWWINPSSGYKGITCFLVTKDMGIQIAKKEQKHGITLAQRAP
jgi:short/branched chain acyl-CoA dehydrogenase